MNSKTVMKKRTLIILIIIIAVIAGSYAAARYWAYSLYNNTDAGGVPAATIEVAGQTVHPVRAAVDVQVFSSPSLAAFLGVNPVKSMDCVWTDAGWQAAPDGAANDTQDTAANLGSLGEAPFALEVSMPGPLSWSISLSHNEPGADNAPIFTEGPLASDAGASTSASGENVFTDSVAVQQAGDYAIDFQGVLPENADGGAAGSIFYRAYFTVANPPPVFTAGRTELQQGDVLSLSLENVPEGIVPEIESDLGPAVFAKGSPLQEGDNAAAAPLNGLTDWFAAVPISNVRAVGDYPVTVKAGDSEYSVVVTVKKFDFPFQDMTIDTSIPSVSAATSPQALAEFREKVTPLLPLMSDERLWDGYFILPVDMTGGFISTQFGEIRITNGDPNSRRTHDGMDLAVRKGTPVHASNRGKVILSEFLLNTGNTVIIDHGGGLKSIYYHMDTVENLVGTIVEKGDLIGTVGSTGYSTGPHLHFETRIGDQPISPAMLLDPAAGLYSAK